MLRSVVRRPVVPSSRRTGAPAAVVPACRRPGVPALAPAVVLSCCRAVVPACRRAGARASRAGAPAGCPLFGPNGQALSAPPSVPVCKLLKSVRIRTIFWKCAQACRRDTRYTLAPPPGPPDTQQESDTSVHSSTCPARCSDATSSRGRSGGSTCRLAPARGPGEIGSAAKPRARAETSTGSGRRKRPPPAQRDAAGSRWRSAPPTRRGAYRRSHPDLHETSARAQGEPNGESSIRSDGREM